MTNGELRGGYVRCKECGDALRATRAVGLRDQWPMHLFCAQDRQDDEGAGGHAVAAALALEIWSKDDAVTA